MPPTHRRSSYQSLVGWQRAMDVCLLVYRATREFPPAERYGLTAETRKTARSVLYNIAEGQQRGPTAEFLRFLRIARGSQGELESQIMLARNLEYISQEVFNELIRINEEVGRILFGLIRSIRKHDYPNPT